MTEPSWRSADDATVHPRPSLRRRWASLNGAWDFALDEDAAWSRPEQVAFTQQIAVPYSPGTPASGVDAEGRFVRAWYRRRIRADPGDGHRLLLWCNAADRVTTVWVDGHRAGGHVGGYTPFAVDLTDDLAGADAEIVVQVDDDHGDMSVPRGKQDWRDEPHMIWYPPTAGLWGEVWLERVPATRIADVGWHGDAAALELSLRVRVEGHIPAGLRLRVRVARAGRVLADDTCLVTGPEVRRTFRVGDGSMDDRWGLLWWPRSPVLLDTALALVDGDGAVVDEVVTEAALRTVTVDDGRFLLNGRPVTLRFALDQGYWPDTGATPPGVDGLRRDVELVKALGLNGVRKHQKIEDPRFFALADRAGLMVWVELPSAYEPGPASAAELLTEWADVVAVHRHHPSVVAWVPVNESWGVPDIERDARQQALVEALAATATALDGTRPVSANDGWETLGGDFFGIHDYDQDAERLTARYGTHGALNRFLAGRRADGRRPVLDGPDGRRAAVLSEFGGIAVAGDEATWGYRTVGSADELVESYRALWAAVNRSEALAGACWTQLTDTYQEANGLLDVHRRPKAPLEDLAKATRSR